MHMGAAFFHKHRYNRTNVGHPPVGALTDATFVDDLLEGIACQDRHSCHLMQFIKQVVAMIGLYDSLCSLMKRAYILIGDLVTVAVPTLPFLKGMIFD